MRVTTGKRSKETTMNQFEQENTDGYTDAELDALNTEWDAIVSDEQLEPGTDEYEAQVKQFSDEVAGRSAFMVVSLKETTTNREEHMQWCKDRAVAYIDAGDIKQAFTSMCSDVEKHPETIHHKATNQLGMMQLVGGMLSTPEKMRKWILGYN